jgi:N-acetylneuraminic acid mutarotase
LFRRSAFFERGCKKTKPNRRFRTSLEELESRLAPASYVVNARLDVTCLDDPGRMAQAAATHSVVFFESSVSDYQVLSSGLGPDTDAVVLDSSGDGMREMAAFLAHRKELSTVGIVAHGSPGALSLGAATLNAEHLRSYAPELAALASALSPGGELDLWSCEAGAAQAGQSLVQDLAKVTGARVAAAAQPVGSAALGGSWRLDVRVGGAEPSVPFSTAALGAFPALLAAWSLTTPLATPRYDHTATLLNSGKVLVVGGYGSDYLASAELFDPATNTWSPAGSLATARQYFTATLLANGEVLVAGGAGRTVTGELASAELYNPTTNTWSSVGYLATARDHHTATLLANGKVLVAGGWAGPTLSSAELFDPLTNTWSLASPMGTARHSATATLLPSGKVLVAGGADKNGNPLASAELYDPISDSWSPAGSMATARSGQTATLLANGRVLVAGGDGTYPIGRLASAEVYDPATNTWSSAGSMAAARTNSTATLLGNGKVLLTGGSGNGRSGNTELGSTELYDPLTNTWSSAGDMTIVRFGHTATLLGNGNVLIVGGYGSPQDQSVEIYFPTASAIPSLFSTGVDNLGVALADGLTDPHYTFTSVPIGSGFGPRAFVVNQNSAPLWSIDGTTYKWIGPIANQDLMPVAGGVEGTYIYRTTFSLTGFDPGSVLIAGGWDVDNVGVDILINGISTGISRPFHNGGLTRFIISSGFQTGTNTLDFKVNNTPNSQGTSNPNNNPTGLQVQLSGVAEPTGASKLAITVPGGTTVVAGTPFLVTAQATDHLGNPVTSYSGPSTVTAAASPPDPQANLPISATFNSSGFAFFLGDLKTAGSYALVATAGSLSGTSGLLTVIPADASYFTVSVPDAATTGTAFNVIVKALDRFGNLATGYNGKVHFTSSALVATLPADATLIGGQGVFNVTLNTPGSHTITVTDSSATNPTITGTSRVITTRGLTVSRFTPTATGFTVAFSKPIVTSAINLYGGTVANPIQNVTLIGKNTGPVLGPVNGIFVIDPSGASATFKASTDWLENIAGSPTGVLPNDTWTVTLQSGTGTGANANGFFDTLGGPLDGGNSGGHADFITTFTTANDGKPSLTIPDFARGPDGSAIIKVPNNFATGIPITLANAPLGTKDVVFTFNYNSTLLTPTGAGTGDTSGTGSIFIMGSPSNGSVTFTWHNSAGLSGNVVLGDILANVPNSAANLYRAKELLTLTSITLNGAAFTGITSPSVHVNAYFGDLSGDGQITGLDLAIAGNVAAGAPPSPIGLAAYKQVDPGLVGDIGSDGSIDSAAISSLAGFLAQLPTPSIPKPPGLTIAPGGPDPIMSLAVGQTGGDIVNVQVLLDEARPVGSAGMTEAIIGLTYDPKALTVSAADITLGSLPAAGSGWRLDSVVDPVSGQIAIDLYSITPLTQAQAGSLVNIAFHQVPVAYEPVTAVQLVSAVDANGQWFSTEVDDAGSKFLLSPGVNRLLIPTDTSVDTEHDVAQRLIPTIVRRASSLRAR